MRRWRAVALGISFALLGSTAAAAPRVPSTPGVDTSYTHITGADGVRLGAFVVTPESPGPHPLIVMPGSWSAPSAEYLLGAQRLARSGGYTVISYAARGFGDSGGRIEVAGPEDVVDASSVIDWAQEHRRIGSIGMAGISYGAGISLLTAAADRRVRAVGALSGWADLGKSLYANKTVHVHAAESLLALGRLTGRPGTALKFIEDNYRKGDLNTALELAPERSASTKVDQLDKAGPAILLANSFQDGIFPPGQYVDFFDRLHTPKRLMLQPGEHGTGEATGALGLPNEVWSNLTRWFGHYLRGAGNGIDTESPVQLKPAKQDTYRGYASWAAAQGAQHRQYLSAQGIGARPRSWSERIEAGVPTPADSGPPSGYLGTPVTTPIPAVSRKNAGVWSAAPVATDTPVTGTPRLAVTATPSARDTTLFAYLYDTDAHGNGQLITHEPVTIRGAEPGVPQRIELALEPTSWTVPAGHHLSLVVDTMDGRYASAATKGSTVTFGSSPQHPATLTY
ncbi:CocE/NonD family hydrolase [Sciscionella sediminilitoris]|uniref:CocE/NonD family hydrolase n=1 Tax=Sciscionella sediminilitoris TaxID=1445613 RepID=UPI0004DF19F1|nr:CocE/NonD family hydrolase [Sciscionella sp. SE31]